MANFTKMVLIPQREYENLRKRQSAPVAKPSDSVTDVDLEMGEQMMKRLKEDEQRASSSPGLSGQAEESMESEEGRLDDVLERASNYFTKKDNEKGSMLIKRMFATKKMQIHMSEHIVRLDGIEYSVVQFIDLILICISKKKPGASEKFSNFVTFLKTHGIPLNLVQNPYVKNMIHDQFDESKDKTLFPTNFNEKHITTHASAPDLPSLSLSRKGSVAMKPRLKNSHNSQPILWFKKLQDVPFD